MNIAMITLFFLVLAVGWVVLPLMPAIIELRRKTDAEPLRVVRRSDTDIRDFAGGFRDFLQAHFSEQLRACVVHGEPIAGKLDDGTPYRVLPDNAVAEPAEEDRKKNEDPHLTLSCGNLTMS